MDLPQRSSCLVLARRAAHPLPVVITTGPGIHRAQSPEGWHINWGMTVCGLLNPVYRPSGPLGLCYAPGNRGLRPRQRMYQPSGLRTARSGSPAEIKLCSGSSRRDPAVWDMAIGTLGGTIKFGCDELPPNDASMRFSSRFLEILPNTPPMVRFGHVAYLL